MRVRRTSRGRQVLADRGQNLDTAVRIVHVARLAVDRLHWRVRKENVSRLTDVGRVRAYRLQVGQDLSQDGGSGSGVVGHVQNRREKRSRCVVARDVGEQILGLGWALLMHVLMHVLMPVRHRREADNRGGQSSDHGGEA